MTSNDTLQEIKAITSILISAGLTIQEKHPINEGGKISWEGQTDISIALKNIPYKDKYNELNEAENFNFKMLDGALLQLMYEYEKPGRKLLAHRLAYYPSPILERFDSNPENYDDYFKDSEFHDMIEQNIVNCPVRFDFSINPKFFVDVSHPYSHVHFGEYENCRIPLNSPLTPSTFVNFILRNFYNYAIETKGEIIKHNPFLFAKTITKNEEKILHFNIL